MSKQRTVPHLDLAPKIKKVLSLHNPYDYGQLFWWALFFPQTLRCYVEKFGNKNIPEGQITWQKLWQWLRQNTVERQLILQGVVLLLFSALVVSGIWQILDNNFNGIFRLPLLILSIFVGIFLGWAIGRKYGLGDGAASGVASGIAFGLTFSIMAIPLSSIANNLASTLLRILTNTIEKEIAQTVANYVFSGVLFGALFGVAWNVGLSVVSGVAVGLMRGSLTGLALGVLFIFGNANLGITFALASGIGFGISFTFASSVTILRLETWLIYLPFILASPHSRYWFVPNVTIIPVPFLAYRLKKWLRQDWETGLDNANQLLANTLQFIPVISAINEVLAETPLEQILSRVAKLAENPYDPRLVRFASEKLSIVAETGLFKLRLDTPARTSAAGFWYLHQKQPEKAVYAFGIVRDLPYGEELFALGQTLANYDRATVLAKVNDLQMPASTSVRSATWAVLASLDKIVKEIRIVDRSPSRYAKSSALNRALGQLTKIVEEGKNIPLAERDLILNIAQDWLKALLRTANEIGEISITQPIRNPYVIGDPVYGNLFVGREDIMRELEECWIFSNRPQSVVIYGHRRMGKTSILLNAVNRLKSKVKISYVNLLLLGDSAQGVSEVMMAISDVISETVNIPPPSDADLLNLPSRTFKRYLKQIEASLEAGLIIALDEFEKIEALIEAGKIHKDFIGYLRGLVQMSPKIAFAFAGLHTLEEMTADYFQPFFASVINIRVGFLERGATHQLLANPDEDFPLDYKPEALDRIYDLTAGQPYLVQLMGFQLVRHYNNLVFEMGRSHDQIFTVEDVEEVVKDPEFFKGGRYYFDGVWSQAVQGVSGQQTILKSIAPYPEGLTINAIAQSTDIDEATVEEALNTLKRHDVVGETDGRWHIIVELFRRWVLDL
ncbi:MAG: ATP-binding protein [Phormidium sp.]